MKRSLTLLLAIVALFMTLCACGSSGLSGNWICEEVHDGYPDQMTLKSDGTGTVDGISCNWTATDGEIVFSAGIFGTYDYEYKISGSTLYLDEYKYDKQ